MPIRTLVATVVALLALASAAAARPAVRTVTAPARAAAGERVTIEASVAKGKRAKLAFYLSRDARLDRGDAQLASGRGLVVQAQIPAGQAAGSYRVLACAGKRCRASNRPLEVTAAPVATKDLVSGLPAQQALYYRALDAFGDPRVPAKYAGDDSESEHGVVRQLIEQWPTLSPAQRAALNPYFTPPPARKARAARAAASTTMPTCDTEAVKKSTWRTLALPKGHVRVWWLADDDKTIGPRARSFVAEIENHMWPRLVALFGREPMSDGSERCFHGIDGKLDIYMWGLDHRHRALTIPYPPKCTGTPAFIVFNAHQALPTEWEVAHELFHAFQFAYRYKGACSSYSNWDEAAATWAGDYLYPKANDEHDFWHYAGFTNVPFADVSYDGWIFPYAMTQLHGVAVMKAIYDQTESQPGPLQAINAAIPGGFKDSWPEFARVAWNQDPVERSFKQWDGFDAKPSEDPYPTGPWIAWWHIGASENGQTEVDMKIPQQPLSRSYRALKFDPDATSVAIFTPYNPNLHVDAVVKLADGTTKTEDLEKRRMLVVCSEDPSQRIESALLIASNTSMDAAIPGDPPIKVVASNFGCARYTGTVTGVEHVHATNVDTTETWTAHDLVFKRHPYGPDNIVFGYDLVSGSVTWSISGVSQGCEVSASAEIPINPDGSMGELSLDTWSGDHPARLYSALGYNLPQVKGTRKCPTGTYAYNFLPHQFLNTRPLDNPVEDPIAADGVLQGGFTEDEHAGGSRDVSYSWRLVPGN